MSAKIPSRTLILGGVRSGKSAFAEALAQQSGQPVTYLATAQAGDAEMQARIHHHRASRPPHWHTIEEPLVLARRLTALAQPQALILVDCLTLWLTNLLLDNQPQRLAEETQRLLDIVPQLPGGLILVSNETGMGITPLGELTRRFGDEMGRLHQSLARTCDSVVLMVAGLPLMLKGTL